MSLHFKGPLLADSNAGVFANYPIELVQLPVHRALYVNDFAKEADYNTTTWTIANITGGAAPTAAAVTITTTLSIIALNAGTDTARGIYVRPATGFASTDLNTQSFAMEFRARVAPGANADGFHFIGLSSAVPLKTTGALETTFSGLGLHINYATLTTNLVLQIGTGVIVNAALPATTSSYNRYGIRFDLKTATAGVLSFYQNGIKYYEAAVATTNFVPAFPSVTSVCASADSSCGLSVDYIALAMTR